MKEYKLPHTSIKAWAEDDRPREKFILKGRSVLSDAELLAIQLGSGSRNESALALAKRILANVGGNFNQLAKLSVEQLTEFKGVGEAKAINILSALEIGRRRKTTDKEDLLVIRQSKTIFENFHDLLSDLDHEEFWCLFLNRANGVLKKELLSKGGIDATIVDVRVLMKRALMLSASGIVLIHNHPSDKTKPSHADIQITKKIKESAKLLDVELLDHVIVGNTNYYSFADEGIL
jgi:DNA repair protein RadC